MKSNAPRSGAGGGWESSRRAGPGGFLEDIDVWARHIIARRHERDIFDGEPLGDADPERDGIGGSYGPGAGR